MSGPQFKVTGMPSNNSSETSTGSSTVGHSRFSPSAHALFDFRPLAILSVTSGAYKRLLGKYDHASPSFTLSVDHVQGDAYAPPSRVRAIMPWAQTGFPEELRQSHTRAIALCDFVTRVCASLIRAKHLDQNVAGGGGGWGGSKGGSFNINAPGQEVLPRTSAMVSDAGTIELRFTTALPAAGRTILGQQAYQILAVNLPELVRQSLLYANLNAKQLQHHIQTAENQYSLRLQLAQHNLIAFIANGAVLPRASGASAGRMTGNSTVPFESPKDMQITLPLADGTSATGMGIPRGVTLLTGGGFHGKSTLLEAIELGVYNHIPGDGRELVVSDPTAVKIRAEDGRSVSGVDISPFISNLPGGKDTTRFSTEDASGSTSMAANIQEALEVGCKTLLIDEDSSATNLLVRDQRMACLIRNEPITPLVARSRALYAQHGVSTVIVIGGLGDWLSVADNVILMEDYIPRSITTEATEVVQKFPREVLQTESYGSLPNRLVRIDLAGVQAPRAIRKGFISLKARDKNPVDDPAQAEAGIDLDGLDQIVEIGQARLIAWLLLQASQATSRYVICPKSQINALSPASMSLPSVLTNMAEGLDIHSSLPVALPEGDLVGIRRAEFAAALSRLRGLHVS